MRLLNFRVKNFRGIGKGDGTGLQINLADQNIILLIGQNNVGKSSLLHAYDYFFNDRKAKIDDFFDKDTNNSIEIELLLELTNDESNEHFFLSNDKKDLRERYFQKISFKKIWEDKESPPNVYIGYYGNEPEFMDRKKNKKAIESLHSKLPEPILIEGMSSTGDLVSQLQKLVKSAILDHLEDKYEEQYKNVIEGIRCLQDSMSNSGFTSELEDRLNKNISRVFPDLSLTIKNNGNEFDLSSVLNKNTQIQILDKSKNIGLDVDSHGHGVQRQAILSACKELHQQFSLLSSKDKSKDYGLQHENNTESIAKRNEKKKILLIEEPELFLHPSGIRSIKNLLYGIVECSPFQLICATHSPIMVDLERPHSSLVRMEKRNDTVLAHQLNNNIHLKGSKQYLRMIRSFNPYVCEAFFSDYVILVEGPTESVVLHTLLNKYREQTDVTNHKVQTESISIVECGGKSTIPFFQQIFRRFKIKYFVFHDLDFSTDKNGNSTNVWKVNEKIWEEVQLANRDASEGVEVRRFIFDRNFETAHGYSDTNNGKGKPHIAWKNSQLWNDTFGDSIHNLSDEYPIVKCLKRILEDNWDDFDIHDQKWVENRKEQASGDFFDEPEMKQMTLIDV